MSNLCTYIPSDPQPVIKRLTALFIQTELCSKTLKQWLEDTTEIRERKMVVDFFEQVSSYGCVFI